MLLAPGEALDLSNVLSREHWSYLLGEDNHMVTQENSAEGAVSVAPLFGGQAAIVPNNLDPVSRLQCKGHVMYIIKKGLPAPCRCRQGHRPR